MRVCDVCGTMALDGLAYCPSCAEPLPPPPTGPPASAGAGPRSRPSGPPRATTTFAAPGSAGSPVDRALHDTPLAGVPVVTSHRCRSCGASVAPGAPACHTCGHPPMAGTHFCFRCGSPTNPMTDPCPSCGARLINAAPAPAPAPAPPPAAAPLAPTNVYVQPAPYYPPAPVYAPPPMYAAPPMYAGPSYGLPPPKSKTTAALLCFFLGGLGAHRFYTGHTGLGVALLLQSLILGPLTLGLWYIVVFIWVIIDFFVILAGGTDKYGQKLV